MIADSDFQTILSLARTKGIDVQFSENAGELVFNIPDILNRLWFTDKLEAKLKELGYTDFNIVSGSGYLRINLDEISKGVRV